MLLNRSGCFFSPWYLRHTIIQPKAYKTTENKPLQHVSLNKTFTHEEGAFEEVETVNKVGQVFPWWQVLRMNPGCSYLFVALGFNIPRSQNAFQVFI